MGQLQPSRACRRVDAKRVVRTIVENAVDQTGQGQARTDLDEGMGAGG